MAMGLVNTVLFYLQVAVFATTLYAFIHAALQRPDAYTAAEKLTKPVWLAILGVSVLLANFVLPILGLLGAIIAACAAGIYLVDVKPRLLEIQGKSR